MKFHLLSDIHLEFYKKYPGIIYFLDPIENDSIDYLFLCGDIGDPFSNNYKLFLEECSKESYKNIFIIAGNHEYYNHHTHNVTQKIKILCKNISNKLIFLNNNCFYIDNYCILGSTLWSYINNNEIERYISDFTKIKNWSLLRNNNENKKSIKYIHKKLKNNTKFIIITHHCPLYLNNTELSDAFYNNLEDIFDNENIILWLYGHDHSSNKIKIKNTQIISNQFGYPDEKCKYTYKYFEIN